MTTTKFTDEVEIDAPTQVGLVVTGPVTGVGAGTACDYRDWRPGMGDFGHRAGVRPRPR
jgi:hypothetical protein